MTEQELLSRLEAMDGQMRELRGRVAELEHWQLTRMQEDLGRILRELFSEPGGRQVRALRDALRRYDGSPGSDRAAVAVLTELNRVNGQPRDPGLNAAQLRGLQALLTQEQFSAISPIGPQSDLARADTLSEQALAFWRELLSRSPGQVFDFHVAVTDAVADPARLPDVLARLEQMAPAYEWTEEHVLALGRINTRDIEFRNLAWFPYEGDFW